MKFEKGIVSIPMIIGLVIMAIAIPVAGQLALKNQDIRNRAAGTHPSNCTCVGGRYENEGGTCAFVDERCSMGTPIPKPTTVIRRCTMDSECGGQSCFEGLCKSRCTSNSNCGVGQKCSSGHCLSGCVMDSNCDSEGGRCSNGVCVGLPLPTPSRKRVNGSACTLDGDCASTHCIGNIPNRKCAVAENNRPNGSNCLQPGVCASGKCSGGKCVAVIKTCRDVKCPKGQACADGVCFVPGSTPVKGKNDGSACKKYFECASSKCVGGKCIR